MADKMTIDAMWDDSSVDVSTEVNFIWSIANKLRGPYRSYRVNICRLCLIITLVVRNYYEKNKEKFDFLNYDILDWDEVTEKMKRLNRHKERVDYE